MPDPSSHPPDPALPELPAPLLRRLDLLLATEGVQAARDHLRAHDARTLQEQIHLTEMPAPPFAEHDRGTLMAEFMARSGLTSVEIDPVGNVRGWLHGPGPAPTVLAAHLDTVFPAETDVTVHRRGSRYQAPGIADDARGLAAILATVRALAGSGLRPARPLLVVATVGEEGDGDLRGVRHLFGAQGAAREAAAFISLDGAGSGPIVTRGVGARRWRVTVEGPGGHSWIDWGAPNPIHLLARAITRLEAAERPGGVTLSVGRLQGGRSVNAIPEEASMLLEIRGVVDDDLRRFGTRVDAILRGTLDEEGGRGYVGEGSPRMRLEVVGKRPAGRTPSDAPLVRAAALATRGIGFAPSLASSSTDANLPMALGIPAITMGAGGRAGRAHTLEEWYDNEGGPDGIFRALLTILLLDELDPPPPAGRAR